LKCNADDLRLLEEQQPTDCWPRASSGTWPSLQDDKVFHQTVRSTVDRFTSPSLILANESVRVNSLGWRRAVLLRCRKLCRGLHSSFTPEIYEISQARSQRSTRVTPNLVFAPTRKKNNIFFPVKIVASFTCTKPCFEETS